MVMLHIKPEMCSFLFSQMLCSGSASFFNALSGHGISIKLVFDISGFVKASPQGECAA